MNHTFIGNAVFEGGTINKVVLDSCLFESLECISNEVHLDVRNSELKNCQFVNAQLNHVTFHKSTITIGHCKGSTLQDVKFKDVLFLATDSLHLKSCKMKNIVFEECIFLYVDCNNDFLLKATFKRCLFIRCYLRDASALHHLDGSHGFFQTKDKSKPIESANRPFLWSNEHADSVLKEYRKIFSGIEEEVYRLRLDFLKRKTWEEVLAIAFPKQSTVDKDTPTLSEVREKVRQSQHDLEMLCGLTQFAESQLAK